MPTIGAQEFLTMTGTPRDVQNRVEEFERLGIDGLIIRWGGKSPQAVILQTTTFLATAEECQQRESEYAALSGTVVSIVDGAGLSWDSCLVRLENYDHIPVASMAGEGIETESGFLIRCAWSVKVLEASTGSGS